MTEIDKIHRNKRRGIVVMKELLRYTVPSSDRAKVCGTDTAQRFVPEYCLGKNGEEINYADPRYLCVVGSQYY